MTEVLGDGVIRVGVDDRSTAELEKIRAEYHRTMAALGREQATLNINANLTDLRRGLKQAKAEIAAYQAETKVMQERAKLASNPEAKKALKDEIAARDRNVTKLRQEAAQRQLVVNQIEKEAQALLHTRKEIELGAKTQKATTDAKLKAWKTENDALNRAHTEALRMDREAERSKKAVADAERRAQNQVQQEAMRLDSQRTTSINRAQQARRAAIDRDISDVARLQQQYVKASQEFQRANRERDRLGRFATKEERFKVEVKGKRAEEEMLALRERLKMIGARPIEIPIHEDHRGMQRVTNGFKNFWSKLDKASVNVGPFTMRLRSLLVIIATLAPVITALVGTLGALVAVTGAGLAGALGVAGTAAAGFGMAAIGIVTAVKPMITQLTTAHQAVLKYRTAQAKADAMNKLYGKGSKEAASSVKAAAQAHKVMEDQLKSMDPAARKAVKGWDRLKSAWKDMTGPAASRGFGRVIGSTFKTLSSDMPMFAKNTNRALDSVSKGWSKWMSGLRSPEGKSILNNIFSDFTRSIPSIMHGLGQLGTAFGRIFQSFGRHEGSLMHGFDHWATSIANATSHSGRLNARVDQMVTAMQALGHFAQSAGHWLSAIFTPGIGPGVKLLQDMTNALDRHTANMHKHAAASTDFYTRSIQMTEQLYHALAPLVTVFIHWGAIMRPFTKVALGVADAAASVTASIMGWKPLREIVTGLFGAFLAYKAVAGLLALGRGAVTLAKQIWALKAAWTALRTAFAEGGLRGAIGKIGSVFSGSGKAAGAAAEIEAAFAVGGEEAASLQAAAIRAAGTQVAAEFRAALVGGGVAAGAEIEASGATAGATVATESGLLVPAAAAESAGIGAATSAAGGAGAGAAAATVTAGETAGITTAGTEAGVAATAVGGLGAALAGIVTVAGAAGLAALVFGGRAKTAGEKAKVLSDSAKDIVTGGKNAARSLTGNYRGLAQSYNGLKDAQSGVASAQREINKLNNVPVKKRGAQWKADMRAAVEGFNQAYQSQRQYSKGIENLKLRQSGLAAAINKMGPAADFMRQQFDKARTAVEKNVDQLDSGTQAAIHKYGSLQKIPYNVLKTLKPLQGFADDQKKAISEADKIYSDYTKKLKETAAAQKELHMESVNLARAEEGLLPIGKKAAGVIDTLTKNIGFKKVAQIGVEFPDPRKATRVMSQMNRAISAGAPKSKVFSVVADAKSAEQAIRRLNALRLQVKALRIVAQGGEETLARLKAIVGVKLAPKVQKILASDDDAQSKIKRLVRLGIPAKVAKILANDAQAQAVFNKINRTVLRPLTQAINRVLKDRPELTPPSPTTQYVNRVVRPGSGPSGATLASGTPPVQRRTDALIGEGGGPEWRVNTKTGAAYRTAGAEAVRLNPHEAIIPTEPKYRNRARDIFGMVAGDLSGGLATRIAKDLGLKLHKKGRVPERLIPYDTKGAGKNVNLNKKKAYTGWHLESIPAKDKKGHVKTNKKGQPVMAQVWVPPTWVRQGSSWVAPQNFKYHNPSYSKGQFQTGGVPIEAATGIITAFQQGAQKIQTISKQIASAQDDLKNATGTGSTAAARAKSLTAKKKTINARIAKLRREKHHAQHLQKTAAGRYNLAQEDKAILGQITGMGDTIAADENALTTAETTGSLDDWTGARRRKIGHINTLITMLQNARATAKGDWKAELGRQLSAAQLDLVETNNSSFESGVSADSLLSKEQTAILQKITADVALENAGQSDMYSTDWGKFFPQDKTAKGALVDFWSGLLQQARVDKRGPAVIAQFAENLASAQGDLGANQQAGPTVGQLFGTARTSLLRDFASNVYSGSAGTAGATGTGGGGIMTNPSYMPSAAGLAGGAHASALMPSAAGMTGAAVAGGTLSGGAPSGGGASSKTVNVTNNFQAPPADPHTWSQGVAFEMGAAL